MDSNNNFNVSTSFIGYKESRFHSLQDVKEAIATNDKYQLEQTHSNMEEAMDKFDLQGSNELATVCRQEAETSGGLLHQLEPQPEVQKEIGTGVLNKLIKYMIHGKNKGKNEDPITTRAGHTFFTFLLYVHIIHFFFCAFIQILEEAND